MASTPIGRNLVFQIYNADGTEFTGLVMHKSTVESVVMSLGDKITGDVYYKDNSLAVTMHEYIEYNGVKYVLVNPPTVVREGMVSDNSELKGMTKYSFVFYHPMCQLGNFPFCDVAVSSDENMYLSENKIFSWIGKPDDYIAKLNKNLSGTQWVVVKSSRFPSDKDDELSDVIPFNNATIAEAIKTFYDTWGVPYIIDKVDPTESYYAQHKYFKVVFGLPSNEIYESDSDRQLNQPFVFKFGQGVGLKNNSRSPRNNKIVTRISGYGAERNIPYGYPQIPWYGDQRWEYTKYVNNDPQIDSEGVPHGTPTADAYPLYMGIVGGVNTKLIKHPFTRSYLMPSIYSQTVFNKVSPYVSGGGANPNYNPNITLVDYYDAIASQQYPYPNEINPQAPSYESHQFEDIYPELGSASITGAVPLDNNLQPASNWDDTMDDDGNYIQSYFQITLPQLTFDIYACAAITQEMEINMRSGACIGCTFPVEVDWDLYKANFYDEDGNFDPVIGAGHPRDPQKFPDSSAGSISVVVKKENTTFGTLMPNTYQHPVSGDEFVVLGISLPLSYITNAEQRLDESMKSYMLENNVYYFDYPLKFDEYWLANHGYVLSQIRPNSIIRFEYAGTQLALYVKQLAVKYGENVLPQYDITLTDNVEVILNPIGRVADDVEKLSSLISILRENYNRSVWAEIAKKLSKVDDDTASGFIRFMKGLQVGSRFVSGLLGEGGIFRKNADGRTYLEVDEMYVRLKAYFDTVEIREYQHSHGGRVASSAGIKVSHVVPYGHYTDQQAGIDEDVPLDDSGNYHLVDPTTGEETLVPLTTKFYRCYYRAKDGDNTTQNSFQVGDLARCHIVDASQGLSMKDYWRAVVGINEYNTFYNDEYGWTDLSNEASVTVVKGANSKLIKGYMGATPDAPEQGDDLFQLGNIFEQGRRGAIMENTTGPNTPSYQVFQDLGLDTRPQEEQSTLFDPYTTTGKNYIDLGYDSGTGHAKLNVIGDAFIGAADNSSYISYSQADKKVRIKAILDLASTFGDGGSTIQSYLTWNQTQINTLLGDINAIQQQIDGSIETWFYDYMPIDPDGATLADRQEPLIWLDENHTIPCHPYYDWYTTDTTAGNNNERLKHLGDIFYDNKTGRAFRFSNTGTEANPHFAWVEIEDSAVIKALEDAARAQDTADNKRRVFVTQPPVIAHDDGNYVEYDVGDLWVNAQYPSGLGTTYNNDLLRCCRAKPIRNSSGVVTDGTFDINDWQLASKYTDDSALLEFLDGYQGTLTDVQNQIDQKAETWYQDTDPSIPWTTEELKEQHVGDLWYCTSHSDSNHGYSTTWRFSVRDNGSDATPRYTYYWEQMNIPDSVFDMIDGKSTIYVAWGAWGNDSNLAVGDLYIPAADETQSGTTYKAGHVYRWKAVAANTYAWVEVSYTDDTAFNEYITQVVGGATASDPTTAAAAAAIRAVTGALVRDTNIVGGLILTSMVALRGGNNNEVWAGISGLYDDDDYAQGGAKGHGIAAWYGGNNGDREAMQEATPSYPIPDSEWSLRRWAKTLFRFDGSGYLANGNITWGANGSVTIKNITTLYDSQDTNILNELTTFSNMFGNSTWGVSPNTEIRIKPKQHFDHINLTRGTGDSIYNITNNSVLNYGEMLTRFVPLVPLGSIDGFNKIELTAGATAGNGGAIYFHYNGMSGRSSGYIINDADGVVSVYAPTGNIGLKVGTQNGDYIQIGDIRIGYDSANNALEVYKLENNVHAAANIYARGGVSALGYGSGGSGGGGVGDVTWEALAGQAFDGHTIHHSYIDNVLLSYATESYVQSYVRLNSPHELSDLGDVVVSSASHGDILTYNAVVVSPATPHWKNTSKSAFLSGYATETWVGNNYYISNGTIYMNGQSITPSSIVGNYLPLSGGTITGQITRDAGGARILGRDNAIIKTIRTSGEGVDWHPAVAIKTSVGCWTFGSVGGEHLGFSYDTDVDYNVGNNNSVVINLPAAGSGGTLALTSQIPTSVSQLSNDKHFIDYIGDVEIDFNFADGYDPGGGIYQLHTNYTQANKPTTYGILADFESDNGHMQFAVGTDNILYFRNYWCTGSPYWAGYPSWRSVAFLDSNVASATYATSAGSATSAGNADTVDGLHANQFAHRGTANNLLFFNEFNFISAGFSGEVWLNWQDENRESAANITAYYFGNGRSGWNPILNAGGYRTQTNSSAYALTSDGGVAHIGSMSVNYAASAGSAGNADTVDGLHANQFAHRGTANNLLFFNEFNFISAGFSGEVFLNWQDENRESAANITAYYFGNGRSGWNPILNAGGYRTPTNSSAYALTSDGEVAHIGSMSVNYAASAGSVAWSNVTGREDVLSQGSLIDTHPENSCTQLLDGANDLNAFYERGYQCNAYEVEKSVDLTQATLTATGAYVAPISGNVFNSLSGYNQNGSYGGSKFAVYDLTTPSMFYSSHFYWSFGNSTWSPAQIRILVANNSSNYILVYSSDNCPVYGSVSTAVAGESWGWYWNRLRIVVSSYSRLCCFGTTYYSSIGLSSVYMNRAVDNGLYRNLVPSIDNSYVLGTSGNRWSSVYALSFYGTFYGGLSGNASSATQLQTSRSLWGHSFNGTADIDGDIRLSVGGSASIGVAYSSSDYNKYNYITFHDENSTGDIEYCAGSWTSGEHVGHRFFVWSSNGWIDALAIKTVTGNVGIGTASPSQKLDVSGNIYASGNVASGNMLSCSANLSVGTSAIIGTTLSVGSWISASGTIYGSLGAQITGEISATSHITSGGNVTCKNVYSSASSGSIGGFNNIQLTYQADTYPADGGGVYFHWNGATSYSSAYIRHDSDNHLQIFGHTSGFGVQVGSQNNDYLQVGGVRLVYDSANNALKVVGSDGSSAANFYATGAVSALGANTSGGGGTGVSYKSTGNITLANNTWYRIASLAGTSNVGTSSFRIYSVSGNRPFSSKVILSLRGSSAELIKECGCNRVISYLRITTDGTNTYLEVKTSGFASGIVIKADTYEDYSDLDNSLYGWVMYQSAVIGGGTEICTTYEDDRTLTISGSVNCEGEFISGEYYCSGSIYSEGNITTEDDVWASGDVHASSFINNSDARLKDIQDYEATIDLYTLAYAPAIHFKWNNKPDTRTHVGTIAQYWQGVMPEVISESKDGYLSMQYDVLALLAAISVAKKVVDHERRIMELEEENAYLRYEINQLKKVA